MNDKSNNGHRNSQTIWKKLFIGMLVLHVLGCYFMGIGMLSNPQFAFESAFQLSYKPELAMNGIVIGMELLFLGSIGVLGIVWTRKGKPEGLTAGMAVGMYMFLFGIVAFVLLGETQGLIVDSIRGFLTLVLGYMAFRESKR